MKINVLICTINKGIERVSEVLLPEPLPHITYKISHQYTDPSFLYIPDALKRPDVELSILAGEGICRNRNHVISLADADIAIMADDDVRYTLDFFQQLKTTFQQYPQLDLATFRIQTFLGQPPYKSYSRESFRFTTRKRHDVSTVEIAFRIESIKRAGIKFDERFGLRSGYFENGEEGLFIYDCCKAKLNCCYFPIDIVIHPYVSSGNIDRFSLAKNKTLGAITLLVYPRTALLRVLWYAIKKRKELSAYGKSPSQYIKEILDGMCELKSII